MVMGWNPKNNKFSFSFCLQKLSLPLTFIRARSWTCCRSSQRIETMNKGWMRPTWSTWTRKVNEVHGLADLLWDSFLVEHWGKYQCHNPPHTSFRSQLCLSCNTQQSVQNINHPWLRYISLWNILTMKTSVRCFLCYYRFVGAEGHLQIEKSRMRDNIRKVFRIFYINFVVNLWFQNCKCKLWDAYWTRQALINR